MQTLNGVFTRLLELLQALRLSEILSIGTPATGPEGGALPMLPSFDDLVSARISAQEQGLLIAGSLELVGLGDMLEQTGQVSESATQQIPVIVENEIRAAIDPNDLFRRVDDVTYMICFATQDKAVADRRANILSETIRSQVARAFPTLRDTFAVEAITSSVDPRKLMDGGSLTDNLLAVLRHVREDMREVARQQHSSLMRHFGVSFLPVVTPAKRQFALNYCQLDSDGAELTQFQALADPRELDSTIAELDLCLFTRAIEALHNALKKGPCAPLLVPVNFKTLATGVYAQKYGVLASAIPEKYRALLTLELIGLPRDGTTIAAKANLLGKMPISRLAVQLPLEHHPGDKLTIPGLWAVSVSLAGRTSTEPGLPNLLGAFTNNASRLGLLTIAHQANSLGLLKLAAEMQFNFIDGLAIANPCSSPKAPSPAPATLFGLSNVPMREKALRLAFRR